MSLREAIAKDVTNNQSLEWKSERQGSVDRITAAGYVAASSASHDSRLSQLGGCAQYYKLTRSIKTPSDEFEQLREDRATRDKHEAYLILAAMLKRAKGLGAFGGPASKTGHVFLDTSGWYALARAAIDEWVDDLCRHCHGAGEIKDEVTGARQMVCPVCHGHHKHRYSDAERAPQFKAWLDGWTPEREPSMAEWNNAMEIAHGIITAADREWGRRMGRMLER